MFKTTPSYISLTIVKGGRIDIRTFQSRKPRKKLNKME